MKRPFAVIGFSFCFALLIASFLVTAINTAVIFITALLFILTLCPIKHIHNKVYSLCLISIISALLLYQFYAMPTYNKASSLDGTTATVTGTIIEEREAKYGRSYYVIQTDSISVDNAPKKLKIRISTSNELKIEPFSKIKTSLYLSTPKNKYGLDSNRTYKSRGIYLFGTPTDEVEVIKSPQKVPYYYAIKLRILFRNQIEKYLPDDTGGLIKAICLGDKSALRDEQYHSFQTVGIIHIFVVSGMHISIIMGAILYLFAKLRLSPRHAALIAMPIVLLFVMITGFSPSSIRAGIMSIIFLTAKSLFKKSDALNSLGFSAFIMLIFNPFAVNDLSFLLSFSSTLGIILTADKFKLKHKPKHFAKLIQAIYSTAGLTLTANIFILPISVLVFGYIGIFAIPVNVLVAYVATILLIFSIIFIILSFTKIGFLITAFVFIIKLLSAYITAVADFFSSFSFSVISLDDRAFVLSLALCFILVGIVLLISKSKKHLPLTAVLCALIFCVSFASVNLLQSNTATLKIFNTEGGFASILKCEDTIVAMGCGGRGLSDLTLKNNLVNNTQKINLFVIPRNDVTFAGNAKSVIETMHPQNIIISDYGDRLDFDTIQKSNIKIIDNEKSIIVNDSLTTRFCDTKEASAFKITIKGTDILILSNRADIATLDTEFLNCDILICSKAPKNLQLLNTSLALISNTAKMGDKESKIFAEAGITSILTCDNGDITLKFKNKDEFEISTK